MLFPISRYWRIFKRHPSKVQWSSHIDFCIPGVKSESKGIYAAQVIGEDLMIEARYVVSREIGQKFFQLVLQWIVVGYHWTKRGNANGSSRLASSKSSDSWAILTTLRAKISAMSLSEQYALPQVIARSAIPARTWWVIFPASEVDRKQESKVSRRRVIGDVRSISSGHWKSRAISAATLTIVGSAEVSKI
ncbi:hypothetical protein C8R44DRAFT_741443 [Mycena epipterygia]|nr:hypothetical protein C8R44DRAFT_741443 [Mycena epipterygia]